MEGVDELYKRLGYGERVGFGKRPALILIDFNYGCTDPNISPFGFEHSEAISHSKQLLEVSREKRIPVIHITSAYTDGFLDGGPYLKKMPFLKVMLAGSKLVEIIDRLKPKTGEPVIVKKFNSSFFGTNLASLLTGARVDTTILTGYVTSGCVRATCMDSSQSGFRTIIPRECVADRIPAVHEAHLVEMDLRWADVLSVEEVLTYLRELPLFQD
jgi:nicotinamidase-related amidase